jgi:glycosyltransferase involved in cell wall biosynthesis
MIVHSHGPRAGFFSSLVIPKSVSSVFTEHVYTKDYRIKNWFNAFLQSQMMNSVYHKADIIIAVSSAVKDCLLKKKVSKNNLVVVHNAISISPASPRSFTDVRDGKTSKKNTQPVIGNISNLLWQKGQIYLIRAFRDVLTKYPNARLEIIGEGQERQDLEKAIESLKLKKSVRLLGYKKDVFDYLVKWNVFVMPSLAEPFGIAILEAMQVGVPVVATDVGGIIDIVEDKKNGLLVKRKKPDQLSKAILEVLENPKLAQHLTINAHKTLEKFHWKNMVEKVEKIYLEV